ncbi:outer membrane beta-barrel protein [Chitinophaga sp. XS-30]|uniref:outer membrane beta-barrel protein n=1 Tax=Chitinophaga sp. XS-30 TaxID=2604421 RepID=UPI00143D88A3|nr:outer membrane beta-barrel protein [Chitinophaga sp. XS-30]
MNKIILTGCLLLCAILSFAQQAPKGKVLVKITDAAGSPLPYASVAVRKTADSAVVKGQMSDAGGQCVFEGIPEGSYFIHATQLGYAEQRSEVFRITAAGSQVNLKALALTPASRDLKTVDVVAQKPFIERSEGKTILNVESSVAAAGNTAMDLLRRAPGVSVDKDENLVIKGKQGVTVMLDGKITYLSPEALAELLKSMPAETISQIEIITSPSAKYDAAGTSGMINIKTKKGQMTGFNGTATVSGGGGRYLFYNTGLNINWRTKKLNVFGNLNHGDRKNFNTRELHRRTGGSNPLQFRQEVYQINDFMYRSYKGGIDYSLTEKQTIGVMVNGYSNAFWRRAPSATEIANKGGATDSLLHTGIDANNRFTNTSVNLNYKLKMDTSGSEFTIDADYARFHNRMNTELSDSVVDAHSAAVLQSNALRTMPFTNITIKSIKGDLVKVLNKSVRLEAGVKASFVNTENNMRYDSLLHGEYVPVPSQYDQFIYDENVLAAYLIYKQQLKKTDFVLGLRLEQTISDGNSISLKTRVERKYLDYFPNLSIDHRFTDDHKLSLAYTKRINRPGYGQLNPFLFFLDKYTFFRGNSYLTPEYTHNTEMTYMFKQKYMATLGYSRTNDVYDEFLLTDEATNATISTNKNLGTQTTYSLNLTLPFDPVKWWNTSNNVSIYYNQYQIRDTVRDFTTERLAWSFNSTNTFTLPRDYKLEVSGWYDAPNVYGIWKSKAMWSANIGIQKTVLKKKGTLKVNVNDIFASARFQGVAEYNDIYLSVNNRWQNRTVNVSLSYRFGNTKVEAARERKTGSEEELRRAGN